MSLENYLSISIVIPAFNSSAFVDRAIASVLAQSQQPSEIIVVDDGSTDSTADVVRVRGEQVRLIRQANAGAGAARNTGIEAAKGEWIAFLDADDEWLPEKLEMQIEVLKRNPDLVWVTGNYFRCMCLTGRRSERISVEKARALAQGKDYMDDFFEATVNDVWGCTDTMVIRREVLFEAGLFRAGQLRGNDYDMWWRIAYRHPKIGYVAEPLAVYHLDVEGSIIRTHTDAAISCELIGRHLELAREFGREAAFRPCAAFLLRRWMRGMLFEGRGREVRGMLRQFGGLLPGCYRAFMGVFAAFPRATAAGCRGISWFVRTCGLRKRAVRSRRAGD